jgi:hypothetical protein
MSVKIKSQAINLNALIDKITSSKKTLNIGFLSSKEAIIAAKNEYGGTYPIDEVYRKRAAAKGIIFDEDAELTIPPRPFMQNTVTKQKGKWAKTAIEMTKSNGGDIDKALTIVGAQAQSDIGETIEEGNFAPNSPITVLIKDGDNPLIDTGEMSKSIAWEVTK